MQSYAYEREKRRQEKVKAAAKQMLETSVKLQLTWSEFEESVVLVKGLARIASPEDASK